MTISEVISQVSEFKESISVVQENVQSQINKLNDVISAGKTKLEEAQASASTVTGKATVAAQSSIARTQRSIQRQIDKAQARIDELQSSLEEWVSQKSSAASSLLSNGTSSVQEAAEDLASAKAQTLLNYNISI